jgi:uncharacterized protein
MKFSTDYNTYFWDNDVGLFIPYNETIEDVKAVEIKQSEKNCQPLTNSKVKKKSYHQHWLKKGGKIHEINSNNNLITPKMSLDAVKSQIFRFGLKQLTLEVTENCNFRCEYCLFSDNCRDLRNHSEKFMDFLTAKKAIEYYFSLLKENRKYNPLRVPTIGFYGGEPLLNFKLIKKCVEYIKSEHNDNVVFNITTNGSLMDKKIGKWLLENNFSILVSLNGPEKEHDRLRVDQNGNGTFKKVMKNTRRVLNYDDCDNISASVVYDYKTNLFACEEFFNEDDVPAVSTVTPVSNLFGSTYYERFSQEDVSIFFRKFEEAKRYYFSYINKDHLKSKTTLFDRLFAFPIHFSLNTCNSLHSNPFIITFTSTCIPGRKMFVDVKGDIHICERVSHNFPIGDVENGMNFRRIYKIIQDYLKNMDECPECKINKRCDKCFAHFMAGKKFILSSKLCKKEDQVAKKNFTEDFRILEDYGEVLENINYKQVPR